MIPNEATRIFPTGNRKTTQILTNIPRAMGRVVRVVLVHIVHRRFVQHVKNGSTVVNMAFSDVMDFSMQPKTMVRVPLTVRTLKHHRLLQEVSALSLPHLIRRTPVRAHPSPSPCASNGRSLSSILCIAEESPNARRKRNYQQSEADRWLKQAQHDLESSYSDMHSSTGQAAYDWACYKCYRVRAARVATQDRHSTSSSSRSFLVCGKSSESLSLLQGYRQEHDRRYSRPTDWR